MAPLGTLYAEANRLVHVGRQLNGIEAELRGRPSRKRLMEIQGEIKGMGLDPITASERRVMWRRLRRWAIAVLLLGCFLEFGGVPHLRVEYRYSGSGENKTIRAAKYFSVTGMRDASVEQIDQGCPLIVLIPLETSLIERGQATATALWCDSKAWAEKKWKE